VFDQKTPEIKFAIHAIRKAAEVIEQIQTETVTSHLSKEDRSPVTIADFASPAVVAYLLRQAFPSDPLVAEEDTSALRVPPGEESSPAAALLEQVTHYVSRFLPGATPVVIEWIDHGRKQLPAIAFGPPDPIDGTQVAQGDCMRSPWRSWSRPGAVGLLACPSLVDSYRPDLHGSGSLVVAVATRNLGNPGGAGKLWQLHVSGRSEPAAARLLRSFESGHTNVDQIGEFARALGIAAEPVRMDSQAKYAVMAAGKGDLLLRLLSPSQPDYREKIWDQAAGSLVVAEAGGCITDLDGRPLEFSAGRTLARNRGILASNGLLHDAALQALQSIRA
jgi:3'(2'), 5'-bisphosphate nucleotidase